MCGKMSRKFLPQTMDFAGEVPDGHLVCLTDCDQPCEQSVDGSAWVGGGDGGRGGSGVERGMGTEAGLTGNVLRDEHPRASSWTDGSSKGPCEVVGRTEGKSTEGKSSAEAKVQSANRGSKNWVTTEANTMECELAVDWVIQHSTTQTGGPTGCTPVVDTKPNTPSRLAFQTDACFTYVIEASCCDHSIHGGIVLIARHLQEPSKTNWSGSREGRTTI